MIMMTNPNPNKAIAFDPFIEALTKIVAARLAFIRDNQDKLIQAWLAETGIYPSEAVICHRHTRDGGWRTWIEPKSATDNRIKSPANTTPPNLNQS